MHQRKAYGCERGDGVGVGVWSRQGSKCSGARSEVSRRTAQPSSMAVIVSQVTEKNGGGTWGIGDGGVADKGSEKKLA